MIKIKKLHKRFGSLKVLENINLNMIDKGIFSILGPNGSGKTTLIKCILGIVLPDKGSIYINNQDIIGLFKYKKNISYAPQITNFPPNLKVRELIEMMKKFKPYKRCEEDLVTIFNLEDSLEKKTSTLSGGTKQKLNILLAFMTNSQLIILDEPTTGLDPLSLMKFKDLLLKEKNKGKTIIITSHLMSFVEEVSDKIIYILNGEIFFNDTIKMLKEKTKQRNLERSIAKILCFKNNHD